KVMGQVVGPDGKPLAAAVSNSGKIQANGGEGTLSAKASKDIFAAVVNQSGVIEARSLKSKGGTIRLEGGDPVDPLKDLGWQANLGKVRNAEGVVINSGLLD